MRGPTLGSLFPPLIVHNSRYKITGAGIGLRRVIAKELNAEIPKDIDFFELAPENWINVGGKPGRQLTAFCEQRPIIAHGLSLSIGGPAPLDESLVKDIKSFINRFKVQIYSEHLSYTNDGGQLYDLLPMPFTEEAVFYTADRVKRVQDILGQQLSLENVSYYLSPKADMEEVEFIKAVVEEADCGLLLDVNNVYVNSINHSYDPINYIKHLPLERVTYVHIAGHYLEEDGLIVDTHGADVVSPVWDLLASTYNMLGPIPTLLERDFNIPSLDHLMSEVAMIKERQKPHQRLD